MRRVVLVSGHYLQSKRRAGFHWLADEYHKAGWQVIFVTASLSWLSYIRRDHRLAYDLRRQANRLVWPQDRLGSYVWFTPWHPANLRIGLLNELTRSAFAQYGDLPMPGDSDIFASADLIILESTPGLMLAPRCKRIAPNARMVYRVSDDMRLLRNHPAVLDAEEKLVGQFDLVSTPSDYIYRRFAKLPRAALQYHGINKEAFDQPRPNPYANDKRTKAVFVGNAYFDHDFLRIAATLKPDWVFHIIGPIPGLPRSDNIIPHGELPFNDTIPFLQHADVGLQTIACSPGAESFTDSLKILQYTYCRLPIIAPDFLKSPRPNLCLYKPCDREGIARSLAHAEKFERTSIDVSGINSWRELASQLAADLW
jgi:2-beta-glucuronyltransferase